MKTSRKMAFRLNGGSAVVEAPPAVSLQRVLREALGLTGTKDGCREGECGACTVLLDGHAVDSCLVPICQVADREILTIEAFDTGSEKLHPLLQSMVEQGAVQCGFCTPGIVMSAAGLLSHSPAPTEDDIKESLVGNICRCTGYDAIFKAVQRAVPDFHLPEGVKREYTGVLNDDDPLDVISIRSLKELHDVTRASNHDIRFLAGGTDLMVQKTNHRPVGSRWIDISRCAELQEIRVESGILNIGSLVTYDQLSRDNRVVRYARALADAASQVGSHQIRTLATLGGNLGNASPAADGYPVLAALKACVIASDGLQSRSIPVSDLALKPGQTALRFGELIVGITIPISETKRSAFYKSMPRRGQALAKVSVAMALDITDNRITDAGIALGAVGPTVLSVPDAEHLLIGKQVNEIDRPEVIARMIRTATPIDDFRSNKEYRFRMIEIGAMRLLNELIG